MSDVTELPNRLRRRAQMMDESGISWELLREAAAAIERLTHERRDVAALLSAQSAEIERLTRERDEARRALQLDERANAIDPDDAKAILGARIYGRMTESLEYAAAFAAAAHKDIAEIGEAWAADVAAERERCARIADKYVLASRGIDVAAAIRGGQP